MVDRPASSKQGTEETLLDAVERLCAQESPSTVSMRTIAEEAGCSLGLAYNYFDSKDDLIGAALDRMARRIAAIGTSTEDPHDALTALLNTMRDNSAFPRLVTWLVLEDKDVSAVMSGHPLVQQIAEIAGARGAADAVSTAMTLALLTIGTHTYGAALNRAAGRADDDTRLQETVAGMYAEWFPGPPAPTSSV